MTIRPHRRPYFSFDLETAVNTPEEEPLSQANAPPITCAAACVEGRDEPIIWYAGKHTGTPAPAMSKAESAAMLLDLYRLCQDQTMLTWNGLQFDLPVTGYNSGDTDLSRKLALHHVDLLFHIFVQKGWPIGLQTLAEGLGLPGKDPDITGADAPELWRQGQHQRVIDYCAQDARTTLQVALTAESLPELSWFSRSGRSQRLDFSQGWLTVAQAMEVPETDNSWMNDPIPRVRFTSWLDPDIPLMANS